MFQSKIFYNSIWMFTVERAMLFMVQVPSNAIITNKEQVLMYLPERIQRLIIQARIDNEKPEQMVYDLLSPIDYVPSIYTGTKELANIICETDYFKTWVEKFTNDTNEPNEGVLTDLEAEQLFESTTLYQYLIELSHR
jgi:hypothetical protein